MISRPMISLIILNDRNGHSEVKQFDHFEVQARRTHPFSRNLLCLCCKAGTDQGAATSREQAKLSPHSHGTYILGRKQTIMAKQIEKNIQVRITTRKETKNIVTAMSHEGLSELGPESEAMTRADQELWQQVQRPGGRDSVMEIQEKGRWSSKMRSSKPC